MKFLISSLFLFFSLCCHCQYDWSSSDNGIPNDYSPNDFAISSTGNIYLACSKWNGSTHEPKLMKSTDGGNSWSEVSMSGVSNLQNTNSIIFSGSKILLAGSNSSTSSYYVYASTDGGQNWSLSDNGIPSDYSPNDFAASSAGDIYIACSRWNGSAHEPKLMKSTDGGSNWNEVNFTGLSDIQNTNSITSVGSDLLLSGSNSSTSSYYVYSSTDGGQTWSSSDSGIPSGYSSNDFSVTDAGNIIIAASYYSGNSWEPKILRSTDGGNNWSELSGVSGLSGMENTNSILHHQDGFLLSGSNPNPDYYVFSSDQETAIPFSSREERRIVVHPNPTSDKVHIDFWKNIKGAQVTLRDLTGRTITTKTVEDASSFAMDIEGESGMYLIEIRTDDGRREIRKVLKE